MPRDNRPSSNSVSRSTDGASQRAVTARQTASVSESMPRSRGAPQSETDADAIPRNLRDAPNCYILSLAPIRTKLGDKWDQFGPSVHRIAKRLLFSSFDGKGSFQKFGDSYVIQFDSLRGAPAQAAGQRLYDELLALLSKGKGADGAVKLRRKRGEAAGNGQAGFLRGLIRRVKALFRRRGDGDPPADPGNDVSNVPAETGGYGDSGNGNARIRGDGRSTATPRPGSTPVGRRFSAQRFKPGFDESDDSDTRRNLPRPPANPPEHLKLLREAQAMENAIALLVLRSRADWSKEMANREFPPPDLNFIYRSMWNLRSGHLTTYTSVPICWRNSLEIDHGEAIVPSPRLPEKLFELDLLCLENTIKVLDRLIKQKKQVLFMNVVHASTLAHKGMLNEFLSVVESIPQAACRQLIFEIVDLDSHAHCPEVVQMVRTLSPFARAVTASVGLQDRNFAFWKQCGFMAVGADISRDFRAEEQIIANFGHFAAQANRHKLLCYLRELDRYSVTISAVGAGFDFLEGAAIGSSDDPDNLALSKFDIADLYRDTEVVWAD